MIYISLHGKPMEIKNNIFALFSVYKEKHTAPWKEQLMTDVSLPFLYILLVQNIFLLPGSLVLFQLLC